MSRHKKFVREFIDSAQTKAEEDAAAIAAEVDALLLNIEAYEDQLYLCKGTEKKMADIGLSHQGLLKTLKTRSQFVSDTPFHDAGFFHVGDSTINWVVHYSRNGESATFAEILNPNTRRECRLSLLVQILEPHVKPRRAPYLQDELGGMVL